MEPWKAVLPKIARLAIATALEGRPFPVEEREELIRRFPELLEERATFVTLKLNGRLRGCIGSILPRRALIDDVIENARAAAFKDARFTPLTPAEFPDIEIEISLLTLPQPLPWTDIADLRAKLRPGIDGVILRFDGRQATFLPSVWEQLPDFDRFFQHLCLKAGLPADCLRLHPEIYVYQAEKIEEAQA
jgi:AmmeMemoRadiSam system protein A